MFLHVKEMHKTRLKNLMNVIYLNQRTFYTDAVVIALYSVLESDVNELWIEFGKGRNFVKVIRLKR